MVSIHKLLTTAVLLMVAMTARPATLQSQVDRQVMNSGETLELTVSFDEQVLFGEPEFDSLEKDFTIISQNRQSRIAIVNGSKESLTQWKLSLSPKREGKLLIPSFSFEGEVTDAFEIDVRQPTAVVDPGAPVFTEAVLDQSAVYVQQQALLTLRFYTTLSLGNFEMSELAVPGAQVVKVAENQYQKQVAGKEYTVVETRLAIFADSSGELTIPAMRYSGVVNDRRSFGSGWFNQGGQRLSFSTDEKVLTVKPRPANATMKDWLPSTEAQLYDHWSQDAATLTVGEPITRTITLNARGLTGAQLPPLLIDQIDGVKIYHDQPQLEDNTSAEGITGNRIESMAIVPTQAGKLTLPEIRVQWWDTAADQRREAVLPGKTFEVLPGAGGTTQQPTQPADAALPTLQKPGTNEPETADLSGMVDTDARTQQSGLIIVLVAGNALLLLIAVIFAVLWRRARQSTDTRPDTDAGEQSAHNKHFKDIRVAAADHNYAALREAIIQWARNHWQDPRIHTLEQISTRAEDNDRLHTLFQALDACLYNRDRDVADQPDLKALVERLEDIHRHPSDHARHRSNKRVKQDLLPLYPELRKP